MLGSPGGPNIGSNFIWYRIEQDGEKQIKGHQCISLKGNTLAAKVEKGIT